MMCYNKGFPFFKYIFKYIFLCLFLYVILCIICQLAGVPSAAPPAWTHLGFVALTIDLRDIVWIGAALCELGLGAVAGPPQPED